RADVGELQGGRQVDRQWPVRGARGWRGQVGRRRLTGERQRASQWARLLSHGEGRARQPRRQHEGGAERTLAAGHGRSSMAQDERGRRGPPMLDLSVRVVLRDEPKPIKNSPAVLPGELARLAGTRPACLAGPVVPACRGKPSPCWGSRMILLLGILVIFL